MTEMYSHSESSDDEEQHKAPQQAVQDMLNLPPSVNIPPQDRIQTPFQMNIDLYEHQKIGLTWMIGQEEDELKKGGILADAMGLGKTVEALSLILARPSTNEDCRTTLVVAPLSLLRQWEREIDTKVKPKRRLRTLILHSSNSSSRFVTKEQIQENDIVFCTYHKLGMEYATKEAQLKDPGRRGVGVRPLLLLANGIKFHRVILDEAHNIKNKLTKSSQGAAALKAEYRWCMTGTPLMNSVEEIYPLLRFLKIEPYHEWDNFSEDFARPILHWQSDIDHPALARLQKVLSSIMLRRTKNSWLDGKPILDLPERREINVSVTLDKDQMAFYKALDNQSKLEFNKYLRQGTVLKNYIWVLVLLLRLRQACDHPHLIKDHALVAGSQLTNDQMLEVAVQLDGDVVKMVEARADRPCPLCPEGSQNIVENMVILSPCGHHICPGCYATQMERRDNEGTPGSPMVILCPWDDCKVQITPENITTYTNFVDAHVSGSHDASVQGIGNGTAGLGDDGHDKEGENDKVRRNVTLNNGQQPLPGPFRSSQNDHQYGGSAPESGSRNPYNSHAPPPYSNDPRPPLAPYPEYGLQNQYGHLQGSDRFGAPAGVTWNQPFGLEPYSAVPYPGYGFQDQFSRPPGTQRSVQTPGLFMTPYPEERHLGYSGGAFNHTIPVTSVGGGQLNVSQPSRVGQQDQLNSGVVLGERTVAIKNDRGTPDPSHAPQLPGIKGTASNPICFDSDEEEDAPVNMAALKSTAAPADTTDDVGSTCAVKKEHEADESMSLRGGQIESDELDLDDVDGSNVVGPGSRTTRNTQMHQGHHGYPMRGPQPEPSGVSSYGNPMFIGGAPAYHGNSMPASYSQPYFPVPQPQPLGALGPLYTDPSSLKRFSSTNGDFNMPQPRSKRPRTTAAQDNFVTFGRSKQETTRPSNPAVSPAADVTRHPDAREIIHRRHNQHLRPKKPSMSLEKAARIRKLREEIRDLEDGSDEDSSEADQPAGQAADPDMPVRSIEQKDKGVSLARELRTPSVEILTSPPPNTLKPARQQANSGFVSMSDIRKQCEKSASAMSEYQRRLRKEFVSSAKMDIIMAILRGNRASEPREKTLVFSLWTSFLDLLEIAMEKEKVKFTRFDGAMKPEHRDAAVSNFTDSPDIEVILLSLNAGNVGLNLTAASQVIIVEPFWNPFIEEQAINRAHRIGQRRPVTVHRLLAKDTVEQYILEMQTRKRLLVGAALGEKGNLGAGRLTNDELKALFGV